MSLQKTELTFEEYYSRIKRIYQIPDELDKSFSKVWESVFNLMQSFIRHQNKAQNLTKQLTRGTKAQVVTCDEILKLYHYSEN